MRKGNSPAAQGIRQYIKVIWTERRTQQGMLYEDLLIDASDFCFLLFSEH